MGWRGFDPVAALDALADAVVVADADNRILAVNPAVERLLGHDADALVGRPLTVLMPPRYHAAHLAGFGRFVATGEPTILGEAIRVPALRSDGTEVPIDLLVSTSEHDGRRVLVGALRDVRGRLDLEHRQAVAARLLEVLAASDSLGEAASGALEAVGDELGWEAAALWVVDESKRRLRSVALWHRPDFPLPSFGLLTEALAFTPGEGLPGRVWRDGKPTWVEDIAADVNFPRAAAAEKDGLRSGCAVPVTADGEVLGVIELFSADVRRPDDGLLDAMESIGGLLGEFVERWLAQEALAASQERLDLALRAGRMGTWELDVRTGYLSLSRQGAALMGARDPASIASVEDYLRLVHPDDRDAVRSELWDDEGRTGELRTAHRVVGGDGAVLWIEVVGRVMRDGAGRRVLVGVASEVTERKAIEEQREQLIADQQASRVRMKLLADVSAELASSLEHRTTLRAVARRVVGELADWCRIYGHDGHGTLHVLAEGGVPADLPETNHHSPPRLDDPSGPGRAARSRQVELHPGVGDEAVPRSGPRASMAVPMCVQDRVVGVLSLGLTRSDRGFTAVDVQLAEELARRAAQAIDNSQLYHDLERSARALQASLLPPDLPEIPGADVAARYRPMGRAEVGGDFYDLFPLRGASWGVVVGDVRGKGPSAAGVTGLARWALRGAAMQTKRPHRVLASLNDSMLAASAEDEPRFCTVVFARLRSTDGGMSVAVASGGHPLPLVVRADGPVERVGGQGMLVGAVAGADFSTESTVLGPGDTILFFTDGVLEARDGRDLLGEDGFQRLVEASAGMPPEALVARIEEHVDAMEPGPRDDIVLLALRAR